MVALGFSLVWGIMNIINLAHGAFIMMGAYTSYVLFSTWHLDPFLSLPLAFGLLYVFGYCVQRFVINYVVRAPLLTPFLLTFGLSLLIVNVALFVFHGDTKGITTQYSGSSIAIGPVTVAWTKLWTLVAALIITAGMQAFLTTSRTGRAIRAMALDIDAAQLSGVRVSHLYAVVFGLGAGLAGAAGVLISLSYSIQPSMGDPFVITAFVCCVLGGLGTVQGALVGGLVYGVLEGLRLAVHRYGAAGRGGARRVAARADRPSARPSR